MDDDTFTQIEGRLRADYQRCFPLSVGWEKVATHLLLAYDFAVRGADVCTIDRMKYALMHALRWGHDSRSQPFGGYPGNFDPNLFKRCQDVLHRGVEYVGIWGALRLCCEGVVKTQRIEENRIEFTASPSWKAFDVLDHQTSWEGRTRSGPSLSNKFRDTARELSQGFALLTPQDMTSWFPDFGTCRTLLSPVSNLMREGLVLPSSWSFDDIPIRTIREFWKALLTLAMIHLGVAFRLTGWQDVGMIQLLVKPRDALINWIADGVGIRREIVVRLLDLHSYNRSSKTPDIAIAPFLPLGNDRIAASPWMLTSSSWERNFCACAARTCPALYNSTDGPLAQSLGKELVSVFEKAGFKAAHGLKFKRKGIEGDIDLLVWSPNESYVLAVELYWKIAAGDIMEVLGGEKTCLEKFGRQLPKYQKELSEEAGDLVARAFSLKSRPVVTGWSCGLAARGFVGTPRIENEQYFFVPESLFRKEVLNHKSLKGFCKWANAKSFLPQEGRDFTMSPVDVTSPSGIHVRFWEADSV